MKKLPVYVDASICAPCGGACCKTKPGICVPEEFGAPDRKVLRVRLVEALVSGRYAVDWYEGRVSGSRARSPHYVRPARVGYPNVRDPGWANTGDCINLTPTGCSLEHDARPLQCRQLIPQPDLKCRPPKGVKNEDAILAWVPYRATLMAAVREAETERQNVPVCRWCKRGACGCDSVRLIPLDGLPASLKELALALGVG